MQFKIAQNWPTDSLKPYSRFSISIHQTAVEVLKRSSNFEVLSMAMTSSKISSILVFYDLLISVLNTVFDKGLWPIIYGLSLCSALSSTV